MKIKKWIEYSDEVDVYVSAEDIACAFEGFEGDTAQVALWGINNLSSFLKGIPDKLIKDMSDDQRKLVKEFLTNQANRYS